MLFSLALSKLMQDYMPQCHMHFFSMVLRVKLYLSLGFVLGFGKMGFGKFVWLS
jgi:hypothetical protein